MQLDKGVKMRKGWKGKETRKRRRRKIRRGMGRKGANNYKYNQTAIRQLKFSTKLPNTTNNKIPI
jgi:hypothetical protein